MVLDFLDHRPLRVQHPKARQNVINHFQLSSIMNLLYVALCLFTLHHVLASNGAAPSSFQKAKSAFKRLFENHDLDNFKDALQREDWNTARKIFEWRCNRETGKSLLRKLL